MVSNANNSGQQLMVSVNLTTDITDFTACTRRRRAPSTANAKIAVTKAFEIGVVDEWVDVKDA